jgi:YD repeat-containing protein
LTTTRTSYTGGVAGTPIVIQTNTYDLRNQLIRTVTENGTIVENAYNGDGLRVAKTMNGAITLYLYEYSSIVLENNNLGDTIGRNVYGTNLLQNKTPRYS